MRLSFAGAFADAAGLWRSERDLLTRLAAVFFFVPILGLVLLLSRIELPADATADQLRALVTAFYEANLLAILLVNLTINFGTFAVLMLFLHSGRTLGQVLLLALQRFLPFLAIDMAAGLLFYAGMSLLVLPGLFAFGRTWLMAPAYAAAPERGLGEAVRQGWQRSGGLVWIVIAGAATLTMVAAIVAILVSSTVLGMVSAMAGGATPVAIAGYLVIALIGALLWTALAVLRVAFYRLSAPRQGI